MIKRSFFLMTCVLIFSCNNSRVQEKEKSNLDTNKIDSLKKRLHTDTPSVETNSDQNIFPFDTILSNCLGSPSENGHPSGGSTIGMIDCYENSAIKLTALINKTYNKLYSKLDDKDKQKLKLSQNQWKKFYAAEEDFLYSAFYTWANESKYGHGREHAITQAEWKYSVVRQRLIDLIKYDNEIYEGYTDTK